MVNIRPEQNRYYKLRHQDSNLTKEELLAKEQRVKTWKNKLKFFFCVGNGGEVITIKEEEQLKKIHAEESASKSKQQNSTTNKMEQSIWTMKDQKK